MDVAHDGWSCQIANNRYLVGTPLADHRIVRIVVVLTIFLFFLFLRGLLLSLLLLLLMLLLPLAFFVRLPAC
jgi:hypothetical protein